jgi:hypothetical protein
MIFGVDFSIKSPAVCIRYTDGTLDFLSFPRTDVIKEDLEITLNACDVLVTKLQKEPSLPKTAILTERERSSLNDSWMEVSAIMEAIKECEDDCIEKWAIEGFSFASTGNRLAQLSGYQWLLRHDLSITFGLKAEDMWVFAPMTVKATAGKGNFKKEQMIDAFLAEEDPGLREHPFWQKITTDPSSFQNKKGAWLKPIDDIIDSYWILRTLEKHMNVSQN